MASVASGANARSTSTPATGPGRGVPQPVIRFRTAAFGDGAGRCRNTCPRSTPIGAGPSIRSVRRGATASGDGVNLDDLIDDTEATNWASLGAAVQGRQVTVRLDPSKPSHQVDRVQVSAHLRPPNPDDPNDPVQSRFSALRRFEVLACEAKAGVDCADDADFAVDDVQRIRTFIDDWTPPNTWDNLRNSPTTKGGRNWQTLAQNLPATPVTDIRVHRNDLVISTMGRSLWIMDNVTPLQLATVFVEGLGIGTTTRENGEYTLTVRAARVQGQQVTLSARFLMNPVAGSRWANEPPPSQNPLFTMLRLDNITPFGNPVVPDVYCILITSSTPMRRLGARRRPRRPGPGRGAGRRPAP